MINQNIDVYADVIKAFANGKKIQWKNSHSDYWQDWDEEADIPEYNLAYRYRVKPKIVYVRLYKDHNNVIIPFDSPYKDNVTAPQFAFGDWVSDPVEIKLY